MTLPEPESYLTNTFAQIEKLLGQISGLFQDNLLSADDVHAAPFGPDDTPSVEVVNRAVAFLLRQGDVLNALGQSLNLFQRILHEVESREGGAVLAAHVHHHTEAHLRRFWQHEEYGVGGILVALGFHGGVSQCLSGEISRVGQRLSDCHCEVRARAVAFIFAVSGRQHVGTGRQLDGLEHLVVRQLLAEAIPARGDGQVIVLVGIHVGAGPDVHRFLQTLVLQRPGGKRLEAAALPFVQRTRRFERLLVVREITARNVGRRVVKVEREHTRRQRPGVAVGAEARAQSRVAGRGKVRHVAARLVELVVHLQAVRRLGLRQRVAFQRLVDEALLLRGRNGLVPDAELVNLALEGSLVIADDELCRHGQRGAAYRLRFEQLAVAEEAHGA